MANKEDEEQQHWNRIGGLQQLQCSGNGIMVLKVVQEGLVAFCSMCSGGLQRQ